MTDTVVRIDANEARARRVAELRTNADTLIERVVTAAERLADLAPDDSGEYSPEYQEAAFQYLHREGHLIDSIALLGAELDAAVAKAAAFRAALLGSYYPVEVGEACNLVGVAPADWHDGMDPSVALVAWTDEEITQLLDDRRRPAAQHPTEEHSQ